MKDFVVVARIYNNQLRQRRLEAGMNARALCIATGIAATEYGKLEACKIPAYRKSGEPRTSAVRLSEFFGVDVEDLFPADLSRLQTRLLEHTFDASEVGLLESLSGCRLLPSPDEFVEARETRESVDRALRALSDREREVIERLYGLNGRDEETLEEVGEALDLSRERIRQIGAKSVLKLRHPLQSKILRGESCGLEDATVKLRRQGHRPLGAGGKDVLKCSECGRVLYYLGSLTGFGQQPCNPATVSRKGRVEDDERESGLESVGEGAQGLVDGRWQRSG